MFFLFILIGVAEVVSAQKREVVYSDQQWFQYYNQTKLNDKWTLLFDAGSRWREGFEESSQYIARAAIGYALRPDIRISSGLAHSGYYIADKIKKVEFRPYQEIAVRNTFHKIGLVHRYRIEERFFNAVANSEIEIPNRFNFRFRYSLMLSIPLFHLSKENTDKVFLLNIGDEIFVNAGKDVVNVFGQNRFVVSPSLGFNEILTFSLAWNSQFTSTPVEDVFSYSDVFWLQIKHRLDLSK
ncbi:DUF2490 domain-containing protein [Robertkochia sediminum]|uniref:DUF2490 domain-containing protein n=1 Tax=Robertkochia sediminum TaxID=2785326 RepID=UPI001933366F|nr:DUF2490 domain-containing protein [Robertkochia sediminum]MBL7472043.1 DUF2490 domain-containing protein [Robertkochia sediminum]